MVGLGLREYEGPVLHVLLEVLLASRLIPPFQRLLRLLLWFLLFHLSVAGYLCPGAWVMSALGKSGGRGIVGEKEEGCVCIQACYSLADVIYLLFCFLRGCW